MKTNNQEAILEQKILEAQKKLEEVRKKNKEIEEKYRAVRTASAVEYIEKVIHEGGFPDFEMSYPTKSGPKWSKELPDTVSRMATLLLEDMKMNKSQKGKTINTIDALMDSKISGPIEKNE